MIERLYTSPPRLKEGSTVRVIAPSFSGTIVSSETRYYAQRHVEEVLGLNVSFSEHIDERNDVDSSSIGSRLDDLHQAFADPLVDAIMPIIGGWSSNQLLPYIDWDLIARHPKVFCGFSDISVLTTAMTEHAGIVTYNGPNYSSFGQKYLDLYTLDSFRKATFSDEPYVIEPSLHWTDDRWFVEQEQRTLLENEGMIALRDGVFEGRVFGGTLSVLGLLQGTSHLSSHEAQLLFLEEEGRAQPASFDTQLESYIQAMKAQKVKIGGLVLGRFQQSTRMTQDRLRSIIDVKPELQGIPIIANADFGHTDPRFTFPIGGVACMEVRGGSTSLVVKQH